ncbi:hypothetical protein [Demetria terragena]|uniref:hypothetical protein n=1 Tax=Demetria terragena TaxID=63959 RepID=UPI00036E8055|nr:hypothetical protein [Demetria terragena]
MKRAIASMGAIAAGLTFALSNAAPAQAADKTITLKNPSGTVIARATWDDSHDTLCVRSFVKGRTATVTMELLDDPKYPVVRKSHAGSSSTAACTGNLSIPEDKRAFAIVGNEDRSTDGVFFT